MVCSRSSKLVEIVGDADRHVLLRFSDGTEDQLPVSMDMTEAVQELQAMGVSTKPKRVLWKNLTATIIPAGKSVWYGCIGPAMLAFPDIMQ